MARQTFNEVAVTASKNLPCPVCGKKVRRQKRIWKTVNPFNRNANGVPKTRDEVYADVLAEAEVWKAVPEMHWMCAEEGGDGE